MFWVLLVAFYVMTFPLNVVLMKNIWLKRYPAPVYQPLGENIPTNVVFNAQKKAILCFGIMQPVLASIPLIYGSEWYHYLVCAGASIAYSSSGRPTSYLDKVRSSHLMFASALVVFALSSVIIRYLLKL